MARRPEGDERLVVPACSVAERGRRVYVTELGRYLGHPLPQIYRFLRKRGLLHYASRGAAHDPTPYVTEETALRVIAHCRAIQGEVYLQGKDYQAILARQRAEIAARKARQKARAAVASAEEREHGE